MRDAVQRVVAWWRSIRSRRCQLCGSRAQQIIIAGLPMKLCENSRNELDSRTKSNDCGLIWGFWAFTLPWTFTGWMMRYQGCSYLRALWHWLRWTRGR